MNEYIRGRRQGKTNLFANLAKVKLINTVEKKLKELPRKKKKQLKKELIRVLS